jgi:hypothetical protein
MKRNSTLRNQRSIDIVCFERHDSCHTRPIYTEVLEYVDEEVENSDTEYYIRVFY